MMDSMQTIVSSLMFIVVSFSCKAQFYLSSRDTVYKDQGNGMDYVVKNDTTYYLYSGNTLFWNFSNHPGRDKTYTLSTEKIAYLYNLDTKQRYELHSESRTIEVTASYPCFLIGLNKPSEFSVVLINELKCMLKPDSTNYRVETEQLFPYDQDSVLMQRFVRVVSSNGWTSTEKIYHLYNGFVIREDDGSLSYSNLFCQLVQLEVAAEERVTIDVYRPNERYITLKRENVLTGEKEKLGYVNCSLNRELVTEKPERYKLQWVTSRSSSGLFWIGGK